MCQLMRVSVSPSPTNKCLFICVSSLLVRLYIFQVCVCCVYVFFCELPLHTWYFFVGVFCLCFISTMFGHLRCGGYCAQQHFMGLRIKSVHTQAGTGGNEEFPYGSFPRQKTVTKPWILLTIKIEKNSNYCLLMKKSTKHFCINQSNFRCKWQKINQKWHKQKKGNVLAHVTKSSGFGHG